MSDYLEPITSLDELNDDECLAGYRAGLGFIEVDHMQKSRSYWHGYSNGRADRRLEPISPAAHAIARQMVAERRAKGMH